MPGPQATPGRHEKCPEFGYSTYFYTYTLQDPTAILAKNKQDQDAADKQAAQPSYQPAQEDTAKKAGLPPLVPDLAEETREATAQHLSVMKIIKGNLPSLEKDLAAAKAALQGRPPTKAEADRIGQLSENLAVQQANLQSEADIVSSLETGVVVKTRTAWKVDVIWASYEGYYAKDEKGQPRGWLGAADNAATTFLMNKFMAKAGEALHGGSLPKHTPNDVPKPRASKPKALPVFDAYKDGNERLAEDLAGLHKKFGAADPARNPEYAKALQTVNQKHEIIIKRQALEQDLSAITSKYEAKIPQDARNADRSVKTDHPEYQKIKAAWEGEMKAAWDQHNVGYEGRMKQHLSAVDSAGLKFVETSSTDPNWDLRMSGGNPKSIKSDIDMAARTLAGGQKFARTMSDQGHNVIEYPDRWVITSTDTTVWKPKEATSTFPIKIGSAEHEAQVALDTAVLILAGLGGSVSTL
ncbi:MAG: hypothetical protein NT167_13015 [Verrucomicrobia bacterium]|nr:hypothetical protein [Verrucomicrobiota bacterium]